MSGTLEKEQGFYHGSGADADADADAASPTAADAPDTGAKMSPGLPSVQMLQNTRATKRMEKAPGVTDTVRSIDDQTPVSGSDVETDPVNPDAQDIEDNLYPEGGLRAWLVVLGCWLAMFSSLGFMNALSALQAYMSTNQLRDHSASTIGWITSVFTFLCFFLGVYIGPLFDMYGPRWLILAGTICLPIGLMLLSVSQELWHFLLAFGVLCGTGGSLLLNPAIAAIGHWFLRRRAFATGVAFTANSLGGLVFTVMMQQLFDKVGWAWTIRILALLCLVCTTAANFLIRSRLGPAENGSPHPDVRIFANKTFLLTTVAVFVAEFALFIPLTYLSSYALSKGFSRAFSYNMVTGFNATSLVGRVVSGYFADKIGVFNANILATTGTTFACLGVWLPFGHTTSGLIVFSLLCGVCSGSNSSLMPVAIGRVCKTQEYGRYYATSYTVVSFACLIGVPIAGKIIELEAGGFQGLIILTGVFYAASFAFFVAAKATYLRSWQVWAIF